MRFFEDGPDIPVSLIAAREQGEVVLFCGAGVSAPAGLPDFNGLADDLLDQLTAQESRTARDADESLDRVFSAMVKEFGRAAVDREISRALRTPRKANLTFHEAIIALSRGTDGAAKIVTTNFDLLFERADRTLGRYVPPALPDLVQAQPIDGIVYLHGRLSQAVGRSSGYVISSADFGRAYLAEGWASRFVRELRERYTIVLLGYSANDPPMRYLLEGLSSREGANRTPIYAFAAEGTSASDEAWRDKGVTVIPYSPRDKGHGGLWDSLFAWADTARDRDGWRAKLVALAQRQPAELRPFERGQVVHLVSTKAGASAFASAKPLPPAEWLCVLDANRRYAPPAKKSWDSDEEIDPLAIFGLDNDPPRPEPRPGGGIEAPGEDPLRWRPGDEAWSERQRLSGYHPQWTDQLPPRLYHLARWFGSVLDQPSAIWWAAYNNLPHPGLVREIEYRLDRGGELPIQVTHFWRRFLEAARARQEDVNDLRLHGAAERIAAEGWSRSVLRAIERAIEPVFEIGRPILNAPLPPTGGWDTVRLLDIVEMKVSVTRWADSKLKPPVEILPAFVAILRRTLVRMSEMFEEGTPNFRRTPTLHHSGESHGHSRKESLFRQFRVQFDALVAADKSLALGEVATWDSNDPVYFAKFYLYAAWLPGLLDGDAIARQILAMPVSVFWDPEHSREMLFALRANWSAFAPRQRRAIERRIAAGPPTYEEEPRKDYRARRGARAASWLRWLELNGRALSPAGAAALQRLKSADPRWSDAWAAHADDSMSSWGGMISRVTDPQGLDKAPIADLLTLAATLTTDDHRQLKDYRPFDGVVEAAPLRALSALRMVARKREHPIQFWRSLLSSWPEDSKPRLCLLLGHTLARLTDNVFAVLHHEIASWMSKFGEGLIRHQRSAGFAVFDAVVARFRAAPEALLTSSVGSVSVGGVPRIESPYNGMKTLNSPGGKFARILLRLLGEPEQPEQPEPMPEAIGTRLDALLGLPGNGAGHAAAMIAQEFSWLNHFFPGSADRLVPLFDPALTLSEAMWHGLASDQNLVSDAAGALLKPALLKVLAGDAAWTLDHEARSRLVQQLTNLTYRRGGKAVISYPEARRALMAVSDDERAEAISMLARPIGNDGMWTGFVKPFLLGGWPRQLRYQSEASSRAFVSLIEAAGDRFEEVLDIVEDYLRPVAHLDTFAFRMTKDDEDGKNYSGRFPAATLRMLDKLVGPDRQTMPWNLGELLETIATAAPALRQSDPWRRLKALTQ